MDLFGNSNFSPDDGAIAERLEAAGEFSPAMTARAKARIGELVGNAFALRLAAETQRQLSQRRPCRRTVARVATANPAEQAACLQD